MIHQRYCRFISRLFIPSVLAGAMYTLPALATGDQDSDLLLQRTIVSLHKARHSVFEKQLMMPVESEESQQEQEDALLFVAYLDGRIYHYCQELYLSSGPAGLDGLPCSRNAAGNLQSGRFEPVPESPGQTSAEKVAQLDQELNAALGEFDEMLLKEEEKVAAHIPRQREENQSAPGGWQEGSAGGLRGQEGGVDSAPAGEQTVGDSKPGSPPDQSGGVQNGPTNEGGISGSSSRSQLPPTEGRKDLPEDDDDIVARQLREAAEQETDPEVKEKLWEEYRKYKEGIR